MSGAASKAVTQVHRLSPCGVLGGRPQEKLSDLLQCASFKGLRLTAGQQLRPLPLLSSIEIGEVAIKGSKATVKPLRVSLVEPVAYLLCSYVTASGRTRRHGRALRLRAATRGGRAGETRASGYDHPNARRPHCTGGLQGAPRR